MFKQRKFPLRMHPADVALSLIVIVWGVHYLVVKDAFNNLAPLTFNAIRFVIGLPVLLIAASRHAGSLRLARRDALALLPLGLIGPFGYQVFFVLSLARTTSTNTALLTSTMPLWTAVMTIALGIVILRRQMLVGVAISLVGVVLVILGGSSTSALSISTSDLIGSLLALGAALVTAIYNISIKPLIDRYGGAVIAFWTYILSTAGLIAVAAPDLFTLSPGDIPPRVWPHLLYSGMVSCAFGFLVENYAIRTIGPARTATYYNFTPLVAAVAGVLFMGDPLTVSLVIGAVLTTTGVRLVRRNTWLRPPREHESRVLADHETPADLCSASGD